MAEHGANYKERERILLKRIEFNQYLSLSDKGLVLELGEYRQALAYQCKDMQEAELIIKKWNEIHKQHEIEIVKDKF